MGTASSVRAASGQRDDDQPSRRERRAVRLIFRTTRLAAGLIATVAVVFAILLLITPSVGNAQQLARGVARSHHAVFPGPPVPARFAAALVATEDHRFYVEPGIDPIAIGRYLLGELSGRGDLGAATLYAQLAKMLYTPDPSNFPTQVEEGTLGVKLWYSYSHAKILRWYSDVVYFGHGFYGLAAASCGYFGLPPGRMSWPQAALLAGLVVGPTVDDPLRYPANGRAREEHVLGRLVATGKLTQAQAARYLKTPVSALLAHAGGCRG